MVGTLTRFLAWLWMKIGEDFCWHPKRQEEAQQETVEEQSKRARGIYRGGFEGEMRNVLEYFWFSKVQAPSVHYYKPMGWQKNLRLQKNIFFPQMCFGNLGL